MNTLQNRRNYIAQVRKDNEDEVQERQFREEQRAMRRRLRRINRPDWFAIGMPGQVRS